MHGLHIYDPGLIIKIDIPHWMKYKEVYCEKWYLDKWSIHKPILRWLPLGIKLTIWLWGVILSAYSGWILNNVHLSFAGGFMTFILGEIIYIKLKDKLGLW